MITYKGQSILTKYLVGQASSYAAYLAVGCGAKTKLPTDSNDAIEINTIKSKQNLDFEMFRVPILSRGYVTEQAAVAEITGATYANGYIFYTIDNSNAIFQSGSIVDISGITPAAFNFSNVSVKFSTLNSIIIQADIPSNTTYSSGGSVSLNTTKVVFTAELPSEERYDITEIGIFSAQANPDIQNTDSKNILSFLESEKWQQHGTTISTLPSVYTNLAQNEADYITGSYTVVDEVTLQPSVKELKAFHTNADNVIFSNINRKNRSEDCRYLNNIVLLRGDLSNITKANNVLSVSGGDHIHTPNTQLASLDKNSPSDELRIAFSLINRDGAPKQDGTFDKPKSIRLVIDFAVSESGSDYKRLAIDIADTDGDKVYDFDTNRYFVIKKKLSELITSGTFSWSEVKFIKIYASIIGSDDLPSSNFYLGLDAVRFENVTAVNPLYGMTGYSVVTTLDGLPITKVENVPSLVEFRFGLDVA
jgi:hypothetical protein